MGKKGIVIEKALSLSGIKKRRGTYFEELHCKGGIKMFKFMVEGEGNPPSAYKDAVDYSVKMFSGKDPAQMARCGGGMFQPEKSLILLSSLGQLLQITYPQGYTNFKNTVERPLWQWSFLAINYLWRADGTPLSGDLKSFREMDGGSAFYSAFQDQALSPLSKLADLKSTVELNNACMQLGGELHGWGDAGATLNFFPRFPVTVIFWQGDDEISASANLLFDQNANHYMHTEDIAVVGNLIVFFITELCR